MPARTTINPHGVSPHRAPALIDRTDLVEYGPTRPKVRMSIAVPRAIMNTVGRLPAESGCILLGPVDSEDITESVFDHRGTSTATTYTPDHEFFNRMLREVWIPRGLDCKGFAHSHPEGCTGLSAADLEYIGRILECNPGMPRFTAPIVLPSLFLLRPFIVMRGLPLVVQEAVLEVFDPAIEPISEGGRR